MAGWRASVLGQPGHEDQLPRLSHGLATIVARERLNLEAAKAVKYGGLTDEEALAFVTVNPAKQLRIDDRVGSLRPTMDADCVIWSGNPLSTYTVCEQTWIDGRKFFDREEDRQMQTVVREQRATLIQKILTTAMRKSVREQPKEKDGQGREMRP